MSKIFDIGFNFLHQAELSFNQEDGSFHTRLVRDI